MTYADIAALSVFSLVATITPGPNNLMLLANSANHGLHRAIPHILGIAAGMASMIFLLGIGLDEIYDAVPWLHWAVKVLGSAYLLWLAAKIAFAEPAFDQSTATGDPLKLWEAFMFQWVNPKAWTLVIAALAFLSESDNWYDVFVIVVVFCGFSVGASLLWARLGSSISRLTRSAKVIRRINFGLGTLLALSVVPLMSV